MSAEPATLLLRLDDLRKRLLVSLIGVGVGFLVCWNFAPAIFSLLERPLTAHLAAGEHLAYTTLTEPFLLYMKVAFLAGIFVAAPLILLQLWLFIAPNLPQKGRMSSVPFIVFASLFFLTGGYFGYAVLLPYTCGFFLQTGRHFSQMITVDEYFSFTSSVILAAGLVFEMPILIFFLARIGIVTPAFLIQKMKYAILLAFIIGAILTPPDIASQVALAVPIILLYVLGIGIAWAFGKKV